nr:MAG TPA: hypothetical protein [Caudoviricetes sp.]
MLMVLTQYQWYDNIKHGRRDNDEANYIKS